MRKLIACAALGWIAGCGGGNGGAEPAPPAAVGTAGAGNAASRPAGPISVILVSLDTCRADRLTPYGAPPRNSPFLDVLAGESVTFTNCLSQSSNTGPSHRSLFTGQFVHRHQHTAGRYMRSPYSWAGLLAAAGYDTAAFTGGGFLGEGLGFQEGFQTYVCKDPDGHETVRRGFRTILPQAGAWWSARPEPSRPFFLFLHTFDIHCPYQPEEPWASDFRGAYTGDLDLAELCGREDFDRYMDEVRPTLAPEQFRADMDHLRDMYDAGIAMADDQLGGFVAMLREQGVLERTLLIVTSDHGESLGRRRPYLGHNHLWEEQLRVPLLVRFPGAAFAGAVSPEPVMLIDLLPTVLDYLGLDAPAGVQGESLMPLLEQGRSYGGERLRISQFGDRLSFRFDGRWKLHVRELGESKANVKLFDLREDPTELNSRAGAAGTPADAERVRAMTERFQAWMAEHREEDARWAGQILEAAVSEDVAADLRALGYVEGEDE